MVFTDGKGFVFHPGCLVMVESADEEESDDNEDNDDEGKPGNDCKSRKQTTCRETYALSSSEELCTYCGYTNYSP